MVMEGMTSRSPVRCEIQETHYRLGGGAYYLKKRVGVYAHNKE